jgi:hypothetical protein
MWSPELETLDQLLGRDLPLSVARLLYPDDAGFVRGIHSLLSGGDVRLVADDGAEIPQWRWRSLFVDGAVFPEGDRLRLQITQQGSTRVA